MPAFMFDACYFMVCLSLFQDFSRGFHFSFLHDLFRAVSICFISMFDADGVRFCFAALCFYCFDIFHLSFCAPRLSPRLRLPFDAR